MAYLVFFLCPSHVVDTGASTFKIEEGVYVYQEEKEAYPPAGTSLQGFAHRHN